MAYVLIAASAAVAALITAVYFIRRRKAVSWMKRTRESAGRENRAFFANASIIKSEAGIPEQGGGTARVKLLLNILSDPDKPYTASTVWLVDITAIDYLKQGGEISVKIDADDPKIIYPGASWARYVMV
ncbi:MAG: NADH-quinone oxidoreductase subunit C [Spirochaetes bacterium]|jgi:hypothetical protein|nr:NADH-quinone oxidoreductase subunit C [Spirochaetota bacterium]